ncbi:MAG: hypothetical protein PHV18_04420 [Lachnospiraceae bacterium]|nr:hypothetical protein [Lachnospiraceae bacterium]
MKLFDMIDQYKALLDKKDELAEQTKQNNGEIEDLRNQIAQVMIDEECPKVSRNGFLYSLQEKVKYNKKACDDDAFYEELEGHGLGDIIKRTVNAATLSSTMKELVEENGGDLPEEFVEYISKYEFYDIAKKKETNKTATKAKKKEE